MTGPEYDAELEAFLKRRSPMHRRLSDIDHAEPSLEIDRLVLNRAREAIDTPEQPLYRTSRWALPIGLAAAILIAFTVVLNIEHRGEKVAANAPAAVEQKAAAEGAAVLTADRSQLTASTQRVAPTVPAPAAKASVPAAAAASVPPPAATVADAHSSPDAWLKEINRLRAAGQAADADRELAAFRAAYPTHPAYSVAKPPAR